MIRGGYWGGAWGLSWGGAWGEAWQLLNQPYQELSLKGQVFARSYLASVYAADIAYQIVSVATLNKLSVVDAEAVVAAKQTVTPVEAVRLSRKPRVEITPEHQPRQAPKAQPVAIFRQQGVVAETSAPQTVVQTKDLALWVQPKNNVLHATTLRKRSLIESDY